MICSLQICIPRGESRWMKAEKLISRDFEWCFMFVNWVLAQTERICRLAVTFWLGSEDFVRKNTKAKQRISWPVYWNDAFGHVFPLFFFSFAKHLDVQERSCTRQDCLAHARADCAPSVHHWCEGFWLQAGTLVTNSIVKGEMAVPGTPPWLKQEACPSQRWFALHSFVTLIRISNNSWFSLILWEQRKTTRLCATKVFGLDEIPVQLISLWNRDWVRSKAILGKTVKLIHRWVNCCTRIQKFLPFPARLYSAED